MKTYAKINEQGRAELLVRIPHVVNATESQIAAYAAANGFKELVAVDAPGRYYRRGYAEGEDAITVTWTAWGLDEAKKDALAEVQDRLDAVLDARATIPCTGFPAGIVYDRNALINAGGLAAGDVFIDAADGIHELTSQEVEAIAAALKEYRQGLYAQATQQRAAIAAAATVNELPRD